MGHGDLLVTHTILLASADCSYFYPREASAAPAASFWSATRRMVASLSSVRLSVLVMTRHPDRTGFPIRSPAPETTTAISCACRQSESLCALHGAGTRFPPRSPSWLYHTHVRRRIAYALEGAPP